MYDYLGFPDAMRRWEFNTPFVLASGRWAQDGMKPAVGTTPECSTARACRVPNGRNRYFTEAADDQHEVTQWIRIHHLPESA